MYDVIVMGAVRKDGALMHKVLDPRAVREQPPVRPRIREVHVAGLHERLHGSGPGHLASPGVSLAAGPSRGSGARQQSPARWPR